MRIHRLTLEAIGPFPGRHTIDFDELSAGGLFLLEGPTGAGKTTLIDAVVFALYGTMSGDSSDDRLHSDHAEPRVEPFVELVFSTGAGTFRVWRSPKFTRPKRRGDGVTVQNARAKLWRLVDAHDDGVAVSAHVQEVGDELGRIVVLDRAQFTQTVVLPQGQFASFLHARPEDRRAVLQEVFGTEIYDRLQQRLAEMAREVRSGVDGAARDVGSAAEAVVAAASTGATDQVDASPGPGRRTDDQGTDDPAAELRAAAAELDAPRLRALCDAARERWEARDADAARTRAGAEADEAAARERMDAARDLAARLTRRGALLEAERALYADAEAVRAAAGRLDLARRAAPVAPLLAAHQRAADRRSHAAAAREQAVVAAAAHDLEGVDGPEALRRAHDEATTTLGGLDPLVTVEDELPARSRALARAEAQAREATARTAELAATVDARPARREAIEEEIGHYRDAGTARERALAERRGAQEILHAARNADDAQTPVEIARADLTRAADDARTALDAEHDVRRRWVAGMAGVLAERLSPGRPCAVCGGTDHPAPARPTDEHATDEDVAGATAAREAADARLAQAQARLTGLTERLAALRDTAGGLTVERAQERVAAAEKQLEAAEAAVVRHAELAQSLTDHDAETTRLAAQLADARTTDATRAERIAEQSRRLAEDEKRCAAARGPAASVTERATQVRARARAARTLLEATTEAHDAALAMQDADERLTAALAEAELEDASVLRAALLDETEARALAERVEAHRAEVARVAAGLREPGIVELTGAEEPAAAAARERHEAARAALTRAAGAASETALRCRQVRAATDRLLAAVDAHARSHRRAAPVLRTAALATAGEGNTLDTTLATYVLLRRFEDVVAAANDRLTAMSDGRYALERIDEREGGQRSRKAGLGLRVRDHVTETPRDPHTLSGGETFYVSLCLALGLADVVRSEAGGIELGTLFVDEGFGSLDPETLDAVMKELGRLREGGRAVGVVSHVSEMKDRIPERVSVRRHPSGASTLALRH
ncbi:hypothetical protein GCM10023169_12200 [Georgenia halophila]|uniref:Nuclease SbcCD subunit C n=1 Tax=Georgenia halophila TaxID=620889 RepID=A0ABP8L1C9_9MICO